MCSSRQKHYPCCGSGHARKAGENLATRLMLFFTQGGSKTQFVLDRVFPSSTTQVHLSPCFSKHDSGESHVVVILQAELYRDAIAETVIDVLHGYNGTFFAYGQVSFHVALAVPRQ